MGATDDRSVVRFSLVLRLQQRQLNRFLAGLYDPSSRFYHHFIDARTFGRRFGISDQQLAGSIPVLQQTITLLREANHDYGGHRAKAVTDLQKAIRQLEKALDYSKKKDRHKP